MYCSLDMGQLGNRWNKYYAFPLKNVEYILKIVCAKETLEFWPSKRNEYFSKSRCLGSEPCIQVLVHSNFIDYFTMDFFKVI